MTRGDARIPIGPVPIQRFGKYYLFSKLAEGGMAEIFLAKQVGVEGFEKNVVVKRMLSHLSAVPDFVEMFLDEARLASRLSHPNVVQILDLGFEDGCYFIAMEYLAGEDFSTVIRSARKLGSSVPLHIGLKVVADAAHGLHYAHTYTDARGNPLNVVHRDVSPSNVFVTYAGQVKVLDFGIAKAESRVTTTSTGVVKGKYQYMPPEQAMAAPVDARADVYSLGVCLYEAVCGARPFARDSEIAILNAVLKNEYRPPREVRPDLPEPIAQIIAKALAPEPAARFESALALAVAVEHAARDVTPPSGGVSVAQYMLAFFSPQRVAQKTRIDSLADLRAQGSGRSASDLPTVMTPSSPMVNVPSPKQVATGKESGPPRAPAARTGPSKATAATETVLDPVAPVSRRRPVIIALLAAALVVGLGGAVAALLAPAQPAERPAPPVVASAEVTPVSPAPPQPSPKDAPPPAQVQVEPPPPEPTPAAADAGPAVSDGRGAEERLVVEKPRPPPPPAAPRPIVLSTPIIAQVIKKNGGPVVRCFQEHREELPGQKGKVEVTITIDSSGRVTGIESPMRGTAVGKCLEARLEAVRFPAHVDKAVTVTLPLAFTVQGG